ncbi:YetF domain-containing protein [Roseovarius arcticus]|uniref:YetF domain-containing protein n=1 Tax=Roseovarius arcticus TaxID=2547404 RepID=UPI001110F2DD|nr:YetF domain-containing protein [Roseovarius arcticus]
MEDLIVPFDLSRMFFGTDPALFYLEIVFRTCVVYAYALLLIRWVGGRGIAQMSTVEFLLVIALGSAVGDAMFYPEVPLCQAMLVITVVVVINKILDILIYRHRTAEKFVDGLTAEVVRAGVVNVRTLHGSKIGKSELFESLREAGFVNLGEVRQAYLESSGRFSIFRSKPPQTGLPIEPAWDVYPPAMFGPGTVVDDISMACCECGTVTDVLGRTPIACPHCGGTVWTPATLAARNDT